MFLDQMLNESIGVGVGVGCTEINVTFHEGPSTTAKILLDYHILVN